MVLLLLIGVPVLEAIAFFEVGRTIGWLLALVLLLGTSLLGVRVVRIEGRATFERVSSAVSEHRPPAAPAIDGALGVLGGALLVVPGFITDAVGVILLLPLARRLARRVLSRRYADRVMRFADAAGRFAPGPRARRPADVESTAVEEDPDELGP